MSDTIFYSWQHTPYGINSFSYPSEIVVDGITYSIGDTSTNKLRSLAILDVEGDHITSLVLSECGEYWHTTHETIHVNEFATLPEVIDWAIRVEA